MAEAAPHFTRDWRMLAGIPALAGLGGAGIAVMKDLIAESRRKRRQLPDSTPNLPVEVKPEEAEQLLAKGVDVKLASEASLPSFVGGTMLGAGATGAGMLGYGVVRKYLAKRRKAELQDEIGELQSRIDKVLSDQPEPHDAGVYGALKTAEADYFEKQAYFSLPAGVGRVADMAAGGLWPLGAVGGGAALVAALTSFRKVREEGKFKKRLGLLSQLVRQPSSSSQLQMDPVVNTEAMRAYLARKERERKPDDEAIPALRSTGPEKPKPAASPAQSVAPTAAVEQPLSFASSDF